MITVSAAVKLIPRPPARVDNRNMNILGSSVYLLIRLCLSVTGVLPSSLRENARFIRTESKCGSVRHKIHCNVACTVMQTL